MFDHQYGAGQQNRVGERVVSKVKDTLWRWARAIELTRWAPIPYYDKHSPGNASKLIWLANSEDLVSGL